MRFLRIIIPIVAAAALIGTIGMFMYDRSKSVPPVITSVSGKNAAEVSCKVTDEELLKLVTAHDSKDGDLSDKITVQRNMFFTSPGCAGITFAVCDSDNNVSKLGFSLKYSDYKPPEIKIVNDLIVKRRSSVSLINHFSVEDCIEGDITNKLKVISSDYNSSVAGEYTANCKVTNSYGDTRDMDVKILVTDEKFTADIVLSEYSIYVPVGTTPDFASYISSVKNSEGYRYKISDIAIDASEYNPNEAGIYSVFYRIKSTDGDGDAALTRIFVIVENGEG